MYLISKSIYIFLSVNMISRKMARLFVEIKLLRCNYCTKKGPEDKNLKSVKSKKSKVKETGRKIKAAVLHGPQTLKVGSVWEKPIEIDQVRVDVHYCGITEADILLWRGEHYREAEKDMVVGYEATGRIIEMGKLADERLGLRWGDEVAFHSYPACGALAETCLVNYTDVFKLPKRSSMEEAAVIMENYFSSLVTLGRRASVRQGEFIFINSDRSQSALAAIDAASRVFCAKPIVVSDDPAYATICRALGAVAAIDRDHKHNIPRKLKAIMGNEQVRVILEAEGGARFIQIKECLEIDGVVAFINSARDKKLKQDAQSFPLNSVYLAVSAEHYKAADSIMYRETMEKILHLQSQCVIRPKISAIIGINRVEQVFKDYDKFYGRIIIDLKDHNRYCQL